jgi:hypothetical protein
MMNPTQRHDNCRHGWESFFIGCNTWDPLGYVFSTSKLISNIETKGSSSFGQLRDSMALRNHLPRARRSRVAPKGRQYSVGAFMAQLVEVPSRRGMLRALTRKLG